MKKSTPLLNERQYQGLLNLGEAVVPGDTELPSFKECRCAENVDEVLKCMPEGDLKDLKLLLWAFSLLPIFFIRGLIRLLEWSPNIPFPPGAFLRFLRMGIKGLVMTLYYSGRRGGNYLGPSSHDILGYRVGVFLGDEK